MTFLRESLLVTGTVQPSNFSILTKLPMKVVVDLSIKHSVSLIEATRPTFTHRKSNAIENVDL